MTRMVINTFVYLALYFGLNVTLIIVVDRIARKKQPDLRWRNLFLWEKVIEAFFLLPLFIFKAAREYIITPLTCPKKHIQE